MRLWLVMVMRGYKTGLSLKHLPQEQRKEARHKLRDIMYELSDENLQVCRTYNEQVIELLSSKKFLDQSIQTRIPRKKGKSGKYGVNTLMTACGDARNHIHCGFHYLSTSAKGLLDRVGKFQEVLQWMDAEEEIKYVFWYRSTYAIHVFKEKWKVGFHYIDPFLRGVHHKFFGNSIPQFLPAVPVGQFKKELSAKITELEQIEEPTDGQRSFLNSLVLLQKLMVKSPQRFDLTSIPSGWRNLKSWIEQLELPTYSLGRWASAMRTILSRCYLSVYEGMKNRNQIADIRKGKVRELFTIPFQNTNNDNDQENDKEDDHHIAYKMVSGPEYVIRRYNNEKSLQLLRRQGYFPLKFKFLDDRWEDAIEVRVIPSRKMRQIIEHENVKLRMIYVLPPKVGSGDVDVSLVFSGRAEDFVATKHLEQKLHLDRRDQIAIDINRMGDHALVSSFNLDIPEHIKKIEQRWRKVDEQINKQNQLIADPPRDYKLPAYKRDLKLLYERRKNLRKSYHQLLVNWLGQQLVSSKSKALIIEDLHTHTYGTRKALARAITSMADDEGLYAREVLAVQLYSNRACELHTLPAFNSSRLHVGCGGVIKRSKEHYDIAPCQKCKKMVNTHYNAAIYLEAKYLKLDYKVCLSTIQAYN